MRLQLIPIRTDLQAFRLMISASIRTAIKTVGKDPLPPQVEARLALYTALAPIIMPEVKADPLCLQLTPELAADLAEAKAPDTDEPTRIIQERRGIYIDLPHRAILVGGLQARAIVIKATPGIAPLVVLILTAYGEDPFAGRYAWEWGTDKIIGSAMEDLDEEAMREQVEDLVRLALLYWASGEGGESLPHIPEERLAALRPDKQAARQKTHSLFRVTSLSSPEGRFGRTGQGSGGWHVGVRSRVRGHFRWQPHGPQHSLRRLQWIAAHERGPKDGEERPELHVLDQPRS